MVLLRFHIQIEFLVIMNELCEFLYHFLINIVQNNLRLLMEFEDTVF